MQRLVQQDVEALRREWQEQQLPALQHSAHDCWHECVTPRRCLMTDVAVGRGCACAAALDCLVWRCRVSADVF
jgi:hypothetical protein